MSGKAPREITGDAYGNRESFQANALSGISTDPRFAPSSVELQPVEEASQEFSVAEKRERGIAYFGTLADLEERRGGVSHFRIILTVGPEVTNRQLKLMTNAFLGENFPLAEALAAIHRDTTHAHVHLYVHARQLNNQPVRLGQRYFHLDESWMKVCSEQLQNPEIYEKHMELKGITLEWNEQWKQALQKKEPPPPKPDRWADHHDTRLSLKPWDDVWCGRLVAQTRVAESKAQFLTFTKAGKTETNIATREAKELRGRLDSVSEKRLIGGRDESKRKMAPEIITITEARGLAVYERALIGIEKEDRSELTKSQVLPAQRQVTQEELRFESSPEINERQNAHNKVTALSESAISQSNIVLPGTPSSPGHKAELIKAGEATTLLNEVSRTFGRELVCEARLARTELFISDRRKRSPKEQKQLKEELIAARTDFATVNEEAERGRALLAESNLAPPPLSLTADERSLLSVYSKHVPIDLRERIKAEINQAQIIQNGEDKSVVKTEEELPHRIKAEIGKEAPLKTLPDAERWQMIVNLELAQARMTSLRCEEENFKVMPHRWLSPSRKLSLSSIQEQINERLKRKEDSTDLIARRETIQNELAEERRSLPRKRLEAENQVKSLKMQVDHELAARKAAGLPSPQGRFSEEQLQELLAHAETSKDVRLLERLYRIERAQAIGDAEAAGNYEMVRRLEEKYAGLKLEAEVGLHRDENALAWVQKHSTQILLPAKDNHGRDTAVAIEQYELRKGLKAMLIKLTESQERRGLREELERTKETYLQHRSRQVESQAAYYRTLQSLTEDCRQLNREYGYVAPAAPSLAEDKIAEIRAYAARQPEGITKPWLRGCAQAQDLLNDWNAKPYRLREGADNAVSQPQGQESTERSQKELQEAREQQQRMHPVPSRIIVPRESPVPITRERTDPDRTPSSRRSGR